MRLYIKGIRFKRLDADAVLKFLYKHRSVQVVNARCCAGSLHAQQAHLQAASAWKQRTNIAHSFTIEYLLRLAGEKQITLASVKCKPTKNSVFVSWSPQASREFAAFKKQFNATEMKLKEPSLEKTKAALEKTATFWV